MTALPAPLATALDAKGYGALTPVQSAVLDPALAGRDLLVSAQTGSGKTVAFGLAMAETLLAGAETLPPPDTPRALIVAPTRELALQVRRELEWLYEQAGAIIASCVGGMDIRTERRTLERGAHIVVGTPGRLRDHLERASLDPGLVATVVLDEADEMLDLGFREDLEFILGALPAERRTLLFSATISDGIERLATTFQRDAERLATSERHAAHADIAYRAHVVAQQDVENAIVNVLRHHEARNALVFCKTRATVNHLTARLLNRGFAVVPLSGELAQEERARALQAMRDGRARVCVATDVAARGIDLPGLELVIHADLPSNPEVLQHRSGRTGRAGRKGVSALIVPARSRKKTERLLAMAGVAAEWTAAPSAADVAARDTERLFADPALTAPETAEEHALITALIERFTPRELAAGVTRQYFAARSAPEDIAEPQDSAPGPRGRASFERSFWIRLEVGREQRAEPRWLLPMLCRAGDLTHEDIGAIRIFETETVVQIHADAEARFFNALGPDLRLEGKITVDRSLARPVGPRPSAETRPARGEGGPDPRGESAPRTRDGPRAPRRERPFKPKHGGDRDTSRPRGEPREEGTRHPSRSPGAGTAEGGRKPPRRTAASPSHRESLEGSRHGRSDDRERQHEREGSSRAPRRPPPAAETGSGTGRREATDPRSSRSGAGAGKLQRGASGKVARSGRKAPAGKEATGRRPDAAAPARPDRASALDPSARLERPGAKPRAPTRVAGAKGRKGKPPPTRGKAPRGRKGPGDGSTPPFRPRRG
jgi:ATP-dependent RNA helicase DeaD